MSGVQPTAQIDLGAVDKICDAHHHLWRAPPVSTWPARYLVDDLVHNCAQTGVTTSTIFVECLGEYRTSGPERLRPVGETEFIEEQVADWQRRSAGGLVSPCAGIVGFADLTLGHSVAAVLDAHLEVSPERFKGVRYMVAYHPDPAVRPALTNPPAHLLASADFRSGLAEVVSRGLVFNAWVYHPQLREVADLAAVLPELSIVLEHCGGPLGMGPFAGRTKEVLADWQRLTSEVARHENVQVKLGGLTMDLTGLVSTLPPDARDAQAVAELFKPYLLHLVEQFGPERCMLECNYPFESLGVSYPTLWEAYSIVFDSFNPGERDALFHRTAEQTYGLI